jgi:hypothetical protein
LPPARNSSRAARDAAQIDAAVAEEALVLDGEDCVEEVPRDVAHAHQLALLVVGPVIGPHQLGLQEGRAELTATLGVAQLLDQVSCEPEAEHPCGLRARRVLEGAAVDPDLRAPPGIAPEREALGTRDVAVAEALERPLEIDLPPVEARVQDDGSREHPEARGRADPRSARAT